ncbi:hypothetical protein SAMN05444392_11185 [Seinonella peptonophila]|uniref:Uncharacterized protein n=1 Tax=Seinonella peptonophila TaxID=112248 RepID=A0A1M5A0Z4_9BACL|nr:hypothetical protein [Seinonella peptonophila]SHF23874.1 hypothetical protein SAMN05444392_11185 [Seinonella peptonophila]
MSPFKPIKRANFLKDDFTKQLNDLEYEMKLLLPFLGAEMYKLERQIRSVLKAIDCIKGGFFRI